MQVTSPQIQNQTFLIPYKKPILASVYISAIRSIRIQPIDVINIDGSFYVHNVSHFANRTTLLGHKPTPFRRDACLHDPHSESGRRSLFIDPITSPLPVGHRTPHHHGVDVKLLKLSHKSRGSYSPYNGSRHQPAQLSTVMLEVAFRYYFTISFGLLDGVSFLP